MRSVLFLPLVLTACAAPVLLEDEQAPRRLESTDAVMTRVPGGYAWLGSDAGRPDEGPRRHVGISTFYLDETPVSARAYANYTRAGGRPAHYAGYADYARPDVPVTGVSWNDAACYCNYRSLRAGLRPAYRATGDIDPWGHPVLVPAPDDDSGIAAGFRLPTEAEFEYAARGGRADELFPWGSEFDPDFAKYDEGHGVPAGRWWRLARVNEGRVNDFGLYGMSGNVFQWVQDRYAPARSGSVDPQGPHVSAGDPDLGTIPGIARVRRGGSWGSATPDELRVSRRAFGAPGGYHFDVGFRCALDGTSALRLAEARAHALPAAGAARLACDCRAYGNCPAATSPRVTPQHLTQAHATEPGTLRNPALRERLAAYLSVYFSESVYFQRVVDEQPVLTPAELTDLIIEETTRGGVHPLFLVGVMRAESDVGQVSFARWYNNPMAYHWHNAKMRAGPPAYLPRPGHNRSYRTLRAGFAAFVSGITAPRYRASAARSLDRFHYVYVGYNAPEWMTAVVSTYREVLGIEFDPYAPGADRWIYQPAEPNHAGR